MPAPAGRARRPATIGGTARRIGRWLAALALVVGGGVLAQSRPPLRLAGDGWVYAGGHLDESQSGRPMVGQLYAEYRIPAHRTHRLPIVMIPGGLANGTTFTGTPDGREGWAQYFVRRGYAVYIVDQPGRGRAAYNAPAQGPLSIPSLDELASRLTDTGRENQWPQARLHTQWPGTGRPGDPTFDQYYASLQPGIGNKVQQEETVAAMMALLDKIGPAVILVHSQSGAFAWPIAQGRPALVRAIVAVEPFGPPVRGVNHVGAPDWFKESAAVKPSGLGDVPLAYEPALTPGEPLRFTRDTAPAGEGMVRCWRQAEPARRLAALDRIPVLMVTSEASYHVTYDDCTAAYLRQAGVGVEHVHLAALGIRGNGHVMMFERNSDAIAGVIAGWLDRTTHDRR